MNMAWIPPSAGSIAARLCCCGMLVAATLALAAPLATQAQETLKLAVGAPHNWENQPAALGQQAGIFKKHGLVLDVLFTQGSGETMQAVIAGSVDIGTGVGTYGAMGAFLKGAPIRAIGNATTGAHDLYWYVRADSPIRSIKDAVGKTIAFSTNGSSTNVIVLGLIKESGVALKPTATGSPANTLTAVMSGQIDIGWSSPPLGVEALEQGKIRLVARGSDVASLRNQTVRVLVANSNALAQKRDAIKRFMEAYNETMDWMYAEDKGLQVYAEAVKVPFAIAKRARDEFYPKNNLRPDRLSGVDEAMSDAIALKFLSAPLSKEQLDQFFQYQLARSP
jgi:ABC-type nitrate/sulfonate/bicarbonate transport system substrate-binding protein